MRTCFTIALALTLALGSRLSAQSGGGFDLSWSTLEPGQTSTGGQFALTGVIGQPDVGTLTGGAFTLQGGFLTFDITKNASACWSLYE